MSGHSHYATIHRQKELNDAQRGRVFSKIAKEIVIAVKTGGGGVDPASNFKLRMVMEKARAANMPKDNVERALRQAQGKIEAVEEVTYEGFGPQGVAVVVETATDNRNRTGQEIKNIFERAGGSLAGPGAVSFNFESKGLIVVEKGNNSEEQMLKLIDLGVEDVEEVEDAIEVYVFPEKLGETKKKIGESGFMVKSAELYLKPKSLQTIDSVADAKKVLAFLDNLEDHNDVQKVYANIDIPADIMAQVG